MRTAIEIMMDAVEWEEHTPDDTDGVSQDLPYATHSGIWHIGGMELRVHRLNTGQAIIEASDLEIYLKG